ncbi:hypothetical protein [Gordonia insulae]|uniref:2-isopropylmalate synthase LeuA allosteric (dimerisation) domain-containing protein n=1 Tax=Gordonia insulae TaxID=2420509 RepID=A0A3G8JRE2_9ACTN|nr:hypothetical protein [Gordonia insulae]AZG47503.1 hypothetical protein D7316_04114 [Gordonia insulae]
MTWQGFTDEYAPTGGIRLGAWSVEAGREDMVTCRATIADADRIVSLQASASGPIGAMTSMLHDIGAPVQIVRLHQRSVDGVITTFLLCERDDRQCWAYGSGDSADEANVNALIAGANRLRVSSAGRAS